MAPTKDPIRDLADRAIRESLRYPEHLRGLLERAVPQLASGFDYRHACLIDREFPLEDWRRREADLPFEIPYRVGKKSVPALVVVLIEHQSDTDPLMPLRLLYFAVVYWDKQWREWAELPAPKQAFRLRPVLPLVVYTGATPWGSNRTLADLLGEPKELHTFAPVWQPLFWNLAEQSAEELVFSDNNWLQMMAVLRVEEEEAEVFKDIFTKAVNQLKKIKGDEEVRWHDLMRILLSWVFMRRPDPEQPALLAAAEESQIVSGRRREIEEMASKLGPSMVDLALEKGLKKGLEKGREEGREEGQIQATRDSLKAILQAKFGRLPKKLQREIEAADLDQLRQAIGRAAKCSALAEFKL